MSPSLFSCWQPDYLMALGVWLHLTEDHTHEHEHRSMEHTHLHTHDEHHHHAHGPGEPTGEPHTQFIGMNLCGTIIHTCLTCIIPIGIKSAVGPRPKNEGSAKGSR